MWDDRNDAVVLEKYRVEKELDSVKALCFTQAVKTYHHWRIFTEGSGGVCLEFNKRKLIQELEKHKNLRWGKVNYLSLSQMLVEDIDIDDIPFTKRAPYKDEKEFRILYEGDNPYADNVYVSISLSCLKSITISPWLPRNLSDVIKDIFENMMVGEKITVLHSTLVDNKKWQSGMKI